MSKIEIDHEYTHCLTCPYCGYEYKNSWELFNEGTEICPNCEEEFEYERNVSINYTSSKIEQNE